MLHVECQSTSKLQLGGFNLTTNEIESMSYNEYVNYANGEMNKYFSDHQPSIDEIENLYWKKILSGTKYANNNDMSLFGDDVYVWNLNRFTSKESNIHSTPNEVRRDLFMVKHIIIFIYIILTIVCSISFNRIL